MNAWEWFVTIGAIAGYSALASFGVLLVYALAAAAGKETPKPDSQSPIVFNSGVRSRKKR